VTNDGTVKSQTNSFVMNRRYFQGIHGYDFVNGSPHLKHKALGDLCGELATEALRRLQIGSGSPIVLDMGAGGGMLTLPYLRLGAKVLAADASEDLLRDLKSRAEPYIDSLTVICGDIFCILEELKSKDERFDIICASSFLHHIPEYQRLCATAAELLRSRGVLLTFQDPLRHDSLSRFTYFFDRVSYFGWRLFQGNYVQGIKTRFRRLMGYYRDDLPEDVAEYHCVRNGVDQTDLKALLENLGLECSVHCYWSAHASVFQSAGQLLNLANSFGIIAQKRI
jgi:SAM-dependent methyltransferase